MNGGVLLNVSAGSRRSLILRRASTLEGRKGKQEGSSGSLPSLSPSQRHHLPRQKIVLRFRQRLKIKPSLMRSVSPM
jgi:hypothetical protein